MRKLYQRILLRWFGIKPKSNKEIETLWVSHSIVPKSYLSEIKVWDSELYTNQILID